MNEKRIGGVFGTNLGKESETSESKESLTQLDKGIKSLAEMLSKRHQGNLFFGISDEGEVIGHRKRERMHKGKRVGQRHDLWLRWALLLAQRL